MEIGKNVARENFSIGAFYNITKNQHNPIKTVGRDSFLSPKTPKNTSFWGVTQPPGVAQPLYSRDTTRPTHITCVQVWSKSDQIRLCTNKTDRQTDTTKIMVTWPWIKYRTYMQQWRVPNWIKAVVYKIQNTKYKSNALNTLHYSKINTRLCTSAISWEFFREHNDGLREDKTSLVHLISMVHVRAVKYFLLTYLLTF